jgi:signal transduction histidine kinase/CheY-like chemotaxis protein
MASPSLRGVVMCLTELSTVRPPALPEPPTGCDASIVQGLILAGYDLALRVTLPGGEVRAVAGELERLLGRTDVELRADATLVSRIFDGSSPGAYASALGRVVEGLERRLDVELQTAGGRCVLELTMTPDPRSAPAPPPGGEPRVVVGRPSLATIAARDVTAERLIAEVRAAAAERVTLERLTSQLLANVSHELRTPLVSIKGYNDLLMRGALGPINPRQRRGLEIASTNTERLIDLIETLLDFARREEQRLELDLAPVDLRAVVDEAVGAIADRAAARGLLLSLELGAAPVEIVGDRARLLQIFRALLSNAVKFSDGHQASGEPDIVVELREEGGSVAVAVRDHGIGIPAGATQRIFDRFYQVDASSTRRFGGAGLGLALAKELVELHGGSISVDSVEGRGSTFTVRLPRNPAGTRPAEIARPVVLVAADAASQAAMASLLDDPQLGPLDVMHADGRIELVRRARRHRPDLIVVALPDPAAVVSELRRTEEVAGQPIVVVVERLSGTPLIPRADLVASRDDRARVVAGVARLLGRTAPPAAPPEVVIVEDEVEILDFTRFILEREGYSVVGVTSGEEALARVRPDTALVILDIALDPREGPPITRAMSSPSGGSGFQARIDGLEVCRALKASPSTARVPILIMTAMSGDDVRKVSLAAGADGYLVKPFGVDEFLRQVRLHLAKPVDTGAKEAYLSRTFLDGSGT